MIIIKVNYQIEIWEMQRMLVPSKIQRKCLWTPHEFVLSGIPVIKNGKFWSRKKNLLVSGSLFSYSVIFSLYPGFKLWFQWLFIFTVMSKYNDIIYLKGRNKPVRLLVSFIGSLASLAFTINNLEVPHWNKN